MTSLHRFNRVSVFVLFVLSSLGCGSQADECECPGPTSLVSGTYRQHGPATSPRDAKYPTAGGSNYELAIDTATTTARLTYTKSGKQITETWRKKQKP